MTKRVDLVEVVVQAHVVIYEGESDDAGRFYLREQAKPKAALAPILTVSEEAWPNVLTLLEAQLQEIRQGLQEEEAKAAEIPAGAPVARRSNKARPRPAANGHRPGSKVARSLPKPRG